MAFLAKVLEPFHKWASQRYTASLGNKLKDYGLRYEDLYDPLIDLDVAEALRRLPQDALLARNARLRRAMDLSMKHTVLEGPLRDAQTPFDSYMQHILDEVRQERRERAELGTRMPYQRTLP